MEIFSGLLACNAILELLLRQAVHAVGIPTATTGFLGLRVQLMPSDCSSEATGPGSKMFSNVLYSTVVIVLEQIWWWRPCHACLPDSHDEGFAAHLKKIPGVEDARLSHPIFFCSSDSSF